jgi:OPA family glycerol-3-phosphate transporter-like MFS transporter 1/2
MTIAFDLGGILGGITAGYITDRTGASAIACIIMLIFAIPSVRLNKESIYYVA